MFIDAIIVYGENPKERKNKFKSFLILYSTSEQLGQESREHHFSICSNTQTGRARRAALTAHQDPCAGTVQHHGQRFQTTQRHVVGGRRSVVDCCHARFYTSDGKAGEPGLGKSI